MNAFNRHPSGVSTPSWWGHIREVTMTPALARSFLAQNSRNRPKNKARIDKYADEFRSGRWDFENPLGCLTVIDAEGVLEDSQHRLEGFIASRLQAAPWIVVDNVDPNARRTMDLNRPRTVGDFIAMETALPRPAAIAATARIIFSLDAGHYSKDPLREELKQKVDEYLDSIIWSERNLAPLSGSTRGAFAWAHRRVHGVHADQLGALAEQVKTGLGRGSVANLISRNNDSKNNTTTVLRWEASLKCIRLIEMFLAGEQPTRMPDFKGDPQGPLRRLDALCRRGKARSGVAA